MTASAPASPLPTAPARTVSLYEGRQGELYLSRDDLAFPVPGDWPQRLAAHPCPFHADAAPWAAGVTAVRADVTARQLRRTLQNPAFAREVATLNPTLNNGEITIRGGEMRPGTRAYLGLPQAEAVAQTTPAPAATPAPRLAPVAAAPTPRPRPGDQPDKFDHAPATLRDEPEVELRLGHDLLLCLFRDKHESDRWYVLAHNGDGDFLSRWASGRGDSCPDIVWQLAAEGAASRHSTRGARHR